MNQRPRNLLLADDDADLRYALRRILERAGFVVSEAENGDQALHALEGATFDLLITDLIMPTREGLETIQACRRLHPELPIIAISGGGRIKPDDYLALAKRLGAQRTLAKPFSGEELIIAAQAALAEAR